jgi:hypothetical protein
MKQSTKRFTSDATVVRYDVYCFITTGDKGEWELGQRDLLTLNAAVAYAKLYADRGLMSDIRQRNEKFI